MGFVQRLVQSKAPLIMLITHTEHQKWSKEGGIVLEQLSTTKECTAENILYKTLQPVLKCFYLFQSLGILLLADNLASF